jgi:hypothetical protein
MRKFLGILGLILLIGAGYIYWTYYREYSSGARDGVLQKFSRKGNIFKTYEGEIVQNSLRGLSSKIFYFSVSDQKIADSLDKLVGKDMRVHYTQYQGSLPWRGDNYTKESAAQNNESDNGQYIVDRIEEVKMNFIENGYYPQQGQQQQPQQQPNQQQQIAQPQPQVAQPQQQSSQSSQPQTTQTQTGTPANQTNSVSAPAADTIKKQ